MRTDIRPPRLALLGVLFLALLLPAPAAAL